MFDKCIVDYTDSKLLQYKSKLATLNEKREKLKKIYSETESNFIDICRKITAQEMVIELCEKELHKKEMLKEMLDVEREKEYQIKENKRKIQSVQMLMSLGIGTTEYQKALENNVFSKRKKIDLLVGKK